MKIYTKGGDAGQTGLYGGARVSKDDLRIQTYGTLDELNAALGLAVAQGSLPPEIKACLLRVQGELFHLGAELATPVGKSTGIALISEADVVALEKEIDAWEVQLEPLKNFILPGGTPVSALIHLARTISRRGERELVKLHLSTPVRDVVLRYVNRLSDYLFVCARFANWKAGVADTPWEARR